MEERLAGLEGRTQELSKRMDDLRDDMNRRFQDLRDDMNRRFQDLRNDMNHRFGLLIRVILVFFVITWGLLGGILARMLMS